MKLAFNGVEKTFFGKENMTKDTECSLKPPYVFGEEAVVDDCYSAKRRKWQSAPCICKTDDGNTVYTFEILEGEGYKFIESKSSKIPKYKYSGDAKESFAPVVDGAIFD